MRFWRRVALLAALATLGPSHGQAQSGRSWMNGIVFGDSETNGLAGTSVRLVGDQETPRLKGVELRTWTDQDGKYAFRNVPYGPYRFTVEAQGFRTYEIELYVASDALTELHVRLKREGATP